MSERYFAIGVPMTDLPRPTTGAQYNRIEVQLTEYIITILSSRLPVYVQYFHVFITVCQITEIVIRKSCA